jgi:ATP phosphoribosyltransferase regulatory subunit
VTRRADIAPIPPGALDLAGDAVRRRRRLLRDLLGAIEAAGYEEIIPPTFEYAEVFVRAAGGGGGTDLADRLIRFLDLDGKLLALRYDFTASVARLAATKLATRPTPLRLCYAGKVFRQDPARDGGGRPRELFQVGGELLGDAAVAADIDVVRLTLDLLRRSGAREYQLNLGHVGALAPALAALPPDARGEARRLIDRKDRAGLAALAPPGSALTELPFLIGRREALDRAAAVVHEESAVAAIDRVRAVNAALSDAEREHVVYDFGEVRGLDYYTGIHFEAFVAGAGAAVGAGGRYDDLMGRFGRPLPAVGLALDLDALAEVVP